MTIYPGAEARIKARFTDAASSTDVDPDDVVLKVRDPLGQTITYPMNQLVRDAVGCYHRDVALNVAGTWRYRFEATGEHSGAGEGFVTVARSLMAA